MMGHVCDLLLKFVAELGGEAAVAKVVARAGVEPKAYRFERFYPEEEFRALLSAAMEVLGVTAAQAEHAFAEYFMRVSPKLFPAIFTLSGDARTLLERIPHLHRSIPPAAGDAFHEKLVVAATGPDWMEYAYDSPHRLCSFLIHSSRLVLAHYGETGEVAERECARRGAARCLVRIRFDRPRNRVSGV